MLSLVVDAGAGTSSSHTIAFFKFARQHPNGSCTSICVARVSEIRPTQNYSSFHPSNEVGGERTYCFAITISSELRSFATATFSARPLPLLPIVYPVIPLQLPLSSIVTAIMFADESKYPKWLKLSPYPVLTSTEDKKSPSSTAVPELFPLSRLVSFKAWDSFRNVFSSCKVHLASLPESDHTRAYLTSAIEDFNMNRAGVSATRSSVVGADEVAKDISILEFVVKRALQIPPILKDLRCHPRCLGTKANTTVAWPATVLRSNAAAGSSVAVVRDVKPDIGVYENSSTSETLQLSMEAKRPQLKFSDLKIKTSSRSRLRSMRRNIEEKSGPLHKTLENLFLRVRTDWCGLTAHEKAAALSIAQAVVYGIHTNSGCCILTTFDQTLVLQVKASRPIAKRWQVQVLVSDLYSSETLFCLLVSSIKFVFSTTFSASSELHLRLMQHLDPKGRGNPGAANRSLKRSSDRKRVAASKGKSVQQQKKPSRSRSSWMPDLGNADLAGTKDPEAYQVNIDVCSEGASEHSSDIELSKRSFLKTNSGTLYSVMISNHGYITQGLNKTLLSSFNGAPVVVKYFCSLDERREVSKIENELKMHELVMRRCTQGNYGDFISRLVSYGELPGYGTVLLLEYVGYSVDFYDGKLTVGDEFIEDVNALSDAACWSLSRLHSFGVAHGDVALRNIRAKRLEDGTWQVWLIDLGLSQCVQYEEVFEREAMECEELFRISV